MIEIDVEGNQAGEPAEIELLYVGTDPVRIALRDGRAAVFSLDKPQKAIPAADARDLLSAAVGGGRFVRAGGAR